MWYSSRYPYRRDMIGTVNAENNKHIRTFSVNSKVSASVRAGMVFGIASIIVIPPAKAARVTVSHVSLCSCPGSRVWTCVSMNPGKRQIVIDDRQSICEFSGGCCPIKRSAFKVRITLIMESSFSMLSSRQMSHISKIIVDSSELEKGSFAMFAIPERLQELKLS